MPRVALALALACAASAAMAQVREVPDDRITPGVVASTDAAEVCGIVGGLSYSKRHRQTSAELKRQVMRAYGQAPGRAGDGEVDHRLELALGGADVSGNLWWQPGDGHGATWTYHDKDRLEVYAWRRVCKYRDVPLAAAQAWFLPPADWRQSYCRVFTADPRCAQ
ncbi:MAG: hypothetical protein ACM3II_13820 [Rhodospirillaceae bacterium]